LINFKCAHCDETIDRTRGVGFLSLKKSAKVLHLDCFFTYRKLQNLWSKLNFLSFVSHPYVKQAKRISLLKALAGGIPLVISAIIPLIGISISSTQSLNDLDMQVAIAAGILGTLILLLILYPLFRAEEARRKKLSNKIEKFLDSRMEET
jgi:hypothetical protein